MARLKVLKDKIEAQKAAIEAFQAAMVAKETAREAALEVERVGQRTIWQTVRIEMIAKVNEREAQCKSRTRHRSSVSGPVQSSPPLERFAAYSRSFSCARTSWT